jgi:hypothetical protein
VLVSLISFGKRCVSCQDLIVGGAFDLGRKTSCFMQSSFLLWGVLGFLGEVVFSYCTSINVYGCPTDTLTHKIMHKMNPVNISGAMKRILPYARKNKRNGYLEINTYVKQPRFSIISHCALMLAYFAP